MKLFYCCLLLLGVGALAEEREKRQASYTFPGPRNERAYRPASNSAPVYVEEQDDREVYQAPRRQFQAQPVQQYAPAQPRAPPPAAAAPPAPAPAPPVYEAPRTPAPAPAPRQQSAPPPARRRASTSNNRANKYGSAPQQSLNGHDEEEVEQGPDALTLLLQDSQFACGGKQDGYYADDSVNCQVFHYCVGGAKHSWMCPENTVFHQVHLNCVPDAQDICAQSQKFHFVNEYLYKPVDYEGPNNTARYSQRYYPDGYVVGDPLVAPQEQAPRRPSSAPQQSYPAPAAPAPRPATRQVAPPPPPQPAYRAPPQSAPSYRQAPPSRPASRPSRPVESYPAEAPQGYRAAQQPQSAPAPQAYRPAQAQQSPRQPPPEAYRAVAREPPSSSSYSSEENLYQPQPQSQPRRPSPPAQQARPTAGYAPPREQQYRPSARSSGGGYPAYSSNQAAGVQYDEDY